MTDSQIIERCLAGDRKAEYLLYQKYVSSLYHTAVRIVGNRQEAEDIVQEGFVKIFDRLPGFRGDSGIYHWMKRIVTNLAIDTLRKNKRMPLFESDISEELVSQELQDIEDDEAERIHKAIKNLPEGCRIVLSLFLFEGYKHREIADQLKISESTSKTQFLRAKQLLRQQLKLVSDER